MANYYLKFHQKVQEVKMTLPKCSSLAEVLPLS